MLVLLIEKDLNHGDHIYVRRKGMLYSHHGIYDGERAVIHLKQAKSAHRVKNLFRNVPAKRKNQDLKQI